MAYKRTSAGKAGKGMESPAAMRKGHSAMHKAGDVMVQHGKGMPKGYGNEGTMTRGAKKKR